MGKRLKELPPNSAPYLCLLALLKDEIDLRDIVRAGIAAIELANDQLATTTPGLEQWLKDARAAL
jgi:hypothetical protein